MTIDCRSFKAPCCTNTKSKDLFEITSYFPVMLYVQSWILLFFSPVTLQTSLTSLTWSFEDWFVFFLGGGLNYLNVLLQFLLPEKWLKNTFQVQTFRSLNKSTLDTPKNSVNWSKVNKKQCLASIQNFQIVFCGIIRFFQSCLRSSHRGQRDQAAEILGELPRYQFYMLVFYVSFVR